MADNVVVRFPGATRLDLNANVIRDETPDDMDEIVVIGWDANGEFYFAGNKADAAGVLWLLELAKRKLFETVEELGDGH